MSKARLAAFILTPLALIAADRTVWDGVYSSAQADRGKGDYQAFCASCHSDDLSGAQDSSQRAPALKGSRLMSRKDLGSLFAYIRKWMPADDRGSLDDKTTIDIVAWILQQNSFPAGAEDLKADPEALSKISLTGKP
jgi:cytochrome c